MKRQTRFVPDQRWDLPQYNQMMEFIAEEFQSYNKSFITTENKIVTNWKVQDNGGLQIKVNKATDSILFNSERPSYEAMAVRELTCDDLLLDLEDNSLNYVEVELFSDTTGEDSVAVWDSTANSGDGEEFIQSVDTVTLRATHQLVSNTISFSVGQPQRIPLAVVTTSGGAITDIADARDFLFHLETDWDFDGASFGVPRTDKTIKTVKNDSDAIKTAIKEMKALSAWTTDYEWYQDVGIGPLGLLERLNYILVDGGNISWDLPKVAQGNLIAHISDPNAGIADGDTFVLSDGVTPVTFEFDTDGSAPPNAVTVPIQGTVAQVKTAIIAAINLHAFGVTASPGTEGRIELLNDSVGSAGNVGITESISNGATLAPGGMGEGFDNTELKWTAALRIIAPGRAFSYTIDAQTISNLADGEVCYVTLPAEGTAPAGSLAVTKVASSAYVLNPANTRNYIIAYRSASKIYFGNGWQSVELEDGETNQLGDGISSEWITASGLIDEYDSTPPYWSNHWISPGVSWTYGMSELDSITEVLYNMVIGPQYDESVYSDGGAGFQIGSKVTLPPPFGLGANQTYQTSLNQVEVFFDGRKGKRGATKDFIESANVGAGIGNEIELRRACNNGLRIDFRIQTGGGQDGTVTVDAPDVYDEGVFVTGPVSKINIVGAGARVESSVAGEVDIIFKYPREIGKFVKNDTGVTIAANKCVAWADDGTMVLADADTVSLSDIIGITSESILDGAFGTIIKGGNIPGACSALGALPGRAVYMSETPGELTLTPPADITDTIIRLGWAEPPDGVAQASAVDLWFHPEVIAAP